MDQVRKEIKPYTLSHVGKADFQGQFAQNSYL